MAASLLGPPSVRRRLLDGSVSSSAPPIFQKGSTENGSATYISSGNPCLDLFFHVVPDTPAEELKKRLTSAWVYNPLITLKLICNLRAVRGTGKADRKGFYTAALWLHQCHPKTLACNVKAIAEFGCLKDLLEILYRLVKGPDQLRRRKKPTKKILIENKAKKAIEKYASDYNYHFLHEQISDLFAEFLRTDMGFYHAGDYKRISLASKWCPSLDSSYDKTTLICESIARKVFPPDDFLEYQDMDDAHYAYQVRNRLRKEVLVPLRKALELPEVYICANELDKLSYENMPSVAMNLHREVLRKSSKERFKQYLEDVKNGRSSIAAGALLPHDIIKLVMEPDGVEIAELQWKRMVDDLGKKGKLRNCMAICDVSLEMQGTPLVVSVALGLLVSELSEEPWKGKLITMCKDSELHVIKGGTLQQKTEFVKERLELNYCHTSLQKVFDKILQVAQEANLSQDKMIERVFVFSGMEFDKVSSHPETDYQAIKRKFNEKGYQKVPRIVFWNLRDSAATPVTRDEIGVALVSGFSKNLVTLFLEEGEILNPEAVMQRAISGEEYQKLSLFY